MRPAFTAAQRKHREATSQAMRRMTQTCPACRRRGNFRRVTIDGLASKATICHYCRAEW